MNSLLPASNRVVAITHATGVSDGIIAARGVLS